MFCESLFLTWSCTHDNNFIATTLSYCTGTTASLQQQPDLSILPNSKPLNTKCADGSLPLNCFVNPCRFFECEFARCVPDFCGGCNARCVKDGVDITSQYNAYGKEKPVQFHFLKLSCVLHSSGFEFHS